MCVIGHAPSACNSRRTSKAAISRHDVTLQGRVLLGFTLLLNSDKDYFVESSGDPDMTEDKLILNEHNKAARR